MSRPREIERGRARVLSYTVPSRVGVPTAPWFELYDAEGVRVGGAEQEASVSGQVLSFAHGAIAELGDYSMRWGYTIGTQVFTAIVPLRVVRAEYLPGVDLDALKRRVPMIEVVCAAQGRYFDPVRSASDVAQGHIDSAEEDLDHLLRMLPDSNEGRPTLGQLMAPDQLDVVLVHLALARVFDAEQNEPTADRFRTMAKALFAKNVNIDLDADGDFVSDEEPARSKHVETKRSAFDDFFGGGA